MTTQTIIADYYAGQTLTATLNNTLTDALVATADTVTELNADGGVYSAVFGEASVIAAGRYCLKLFAAGDLVDTQMVSLAGTDGETVRTGAAVLDSAALTPEQQAQLDSIQAQTNLLTAGTRVTVAADAGQNIALKIGDDFVAASNTAKRIEVNDPDSAIYNLLSDNTLTARAFGCGLSAKRDMVTGTIDKDTITHTAASGSNPAYTTVFVECSVDSALQSAETGYDVQITDANGKKHTVFSGNCSLVTDYKS